MRSGYRTARGLARDEPDGRTDGGSIRLSDRGYSEPIFRIRPQELLLSRSAQGVPD